MTGRSIGPVLINGDPVDPSMASVSVFDIGFQRGYGCFESMRSYGGTPFRADQHIERLAKSAYDLRIAIPPLGQIAAWCSQAAARGDGVVRVFVTGGIDAKHPGTDSAVIVFLEPLPVIPPAIRLDVLTAPWHADGHTSELTGAKTLSYGPNLAATISARSRGFDDAALIGQQDVVLEGPTFSLGWVIDGAVCTPGLDSQILASITRQATLAVAEEIGIPTREERFVRDDLLGADEVFVMSSVREVLPVIAVGDTTLAPGPVTARLREGFHRLVARETT
jgi:branched-subunit amino acid aminotransferase/4-amino-4-deoxychorismate lyase